MYIQLGNEVSIRTKEIVGIFNVNTTFKSKDSNDFLKISDEDGFVHKSCSDSIKSVIIAEIKNNSKIFLSTTSSSTLIKRLIEDVN